MKNNSTHYVENPDWNNICLVCGTRYQDAMPESCAICNDERQYVPPTGQKWTSYVAMSRANTIRIGNPLPDVYDLRISPAFGIGQLAHLVVSPGGNLLWDCIPFIDEATIAFIRSKGGLRGIAISHPHYYSLMKAWADAFECPVYLHQADKQWVLDGSDRVRFFEGAKQVLWDGMEIVHTGGHFAGSTILHAPQTGKEGSVFAGDTLQIAPSRQFISIMYSYPNVIPLPVSKILSIAGIVNPLAFDSMYGAFEWQKIHTGAKEIFTRTIARYEEIYGHG
ncbi:MAG: MBL fold metallo-hydrolase [Williamsia sp.]|nr:MBL fold metallo-hydrolase [Williamsia sp.]